MCKGGNTTTQQQTYTPNSQAAGAISGALSQAQNVGQTPFSTPVAPVAGFSPDQSQAFQNTQNAQGQAQPYLDEAQDYFSGSHVDQFLNPYAENVMAGMQDLFGHQMQQTTGTLAQQAGGVGADRIAVGQAELARKQQLAAGQTMANLYQPSLNASQNAGFGIGSLGPVSQNAALQGAQAQLGTGGLQQQLQQAQMNALYQNQLAQIQWPYQNAQFNAGITGALAPGLGGTTSGQTTYPQQNPLGQYAGIGMAALGGYGASGGFSGGSEMTGLPQNFQSPAYNPATNTINPNYQAARGGRINPYADGGEVDDYAPDSEDNNSMDEQIQAAQIQALRDAGNPAAAGIHAPSMPGVRPINVAQQSLIPTGQIPQIQPHIPQLQAPQQQGGGDGGMGAMIGTAMKLAPMLMGMPPMLNRGGAVNGYAEGGAAEEPKKSSYYDNFLKALRGINEAISPTRMLEPPGPMTGSIPRDLAGSFPFASLGMRPGGVGMKPTNTANPQLRAGGPNGGRFADHIDTPRWGHRGVMNSPLVAGAAATNFLPEDSAPTIERPPAPPQRQDDADMMANTEGGVDVGPNPSASNPFEDRWGEMAPPSAGPQQDPLFLQSGMAGTPPSPQAAEHVPLPRSNPFVPMALAYEAKKKRAAAAPPKRAAAAPPKRAAAALPLESDRAPPYRPLHMAEGGEVYGDWPLSSNIEDRREYDPSQHEDSFGNRFHFDMPPEKPQLGSLSRELGHYDIMPPPKVYTSEEKSISRKALRSKKRYAEGGEVEDEFEPPLFLQSSMEDVATPSAGPTRMYRGRPVSNWSQRDPETAYETSKERWGAIRDNPGQAALTAGSLAAPVAGGVISSALENASDRSNQRGMAPLRGRRAQASEGVRWPNISSMLDLSAHAAEDAPPSAPDVPIMPEEKTVIERISGALAAERQKLARATQQNGADKKTGKPLPPSPRMLAISGSIDALQNDLSKAEGPQSPLGARRASALAVHEENVKEWNKSQASLKNRKTESQLPYSVKHAGRQDWLQENAWKGSALTGAALGALGRGKHIKPAMGSGVVGGLEGGFTAAWPTLQDTEFLPEGQTWKQAADRLRNIDPDFVTRVGAGAATHAPIAAGSSLIASKSRDALGQAMEAGSKFRNWMKKPPSETPPVNGASKLTTETAATPKVKAPPQIYHTPDGSVYKKYASGRWTKNGKFTEPPDLKSAQVSPASTLHAPPTQATGGRIHANPYADGGEALRKDSGYYDIDTLRNDTGYHDIGAEPPRANMDDSPTNFNDRWNALSDPLPSEESSALIPTPRSKPEDFGDDVEAAPPPVPPPGGKRAPAEFDGNSDNPFAPPQKRSDLIDSPWMALMQAGLGTMAAAGTRDARGLPTQPLAAIGQGGMKGMEALREQQTAGMKQQSIEQAAKRLEADALRHQRAMGETERHNRATEDSRKEALELQKQKAVTGLFDDETATMMAQQALRGDKSVFANLGRGVAGPQNIVKVRTFMNHLAKEQGYSGADIAALNANFSAQTAGARTAAVRESNISTAVEEAKGTFPLALTASAALPRSDFVPINKIVQAWRTGTSTPKQAEFALAHQAVITAYSQAMSRTGVNTVHAQQRAEEAFSNVQNHEAYEAAIKQMDREMAVALAAPEKARQMILDKISGKKTEETPTAAAKSDKEFTGRTATNPTTGKKVREKADGTWVE